MAMRLLKNSKRLVVFCPNLLRTSHQLRVFSSGDERLPPTTKEDVEDTATTQTEEPDPNLDFLEIKDKRLPFPGNVGLSKQLIAQPVTQQKKIIDHELFKTNLEDKRIAVLIEALKLEAIEKTKEEGYIAPLDPMNDLECVAQECPQLIQKEFVDLFRDHNVSVPPLTVITFSQKTKHDMSEWNEDVEDERDELTLCFVLSAEEICERLQAAGFWADFIDPSSGRPYLGTYTNATMFETDERYRHFGFTIEDLGCCKVISHHLWGSHIFAGCIFTNAPVDNPIIKDVLKSQKNEENDSRKQI